jgi:hypothetical protein
VLTAQIAEHAGGRLPWRQIEAWQPAAFPSARGSLLLTPPWPGWVWEAATHQVNLWPYYDPGGWGPYKPTRLPQESVWHSEGRWSRSVPKVAGHCPDKCQHLPHDAEPNLLSCYTPRKLGEKTATLVTSFPARLYRRVTSGGALRLLGRQGGS